MTETIIDLVRNGYSIEFIEGVLPCTMSIRLQKDDHVVYSEALMDGIELAKMSAEDIILQTIRYMRYEHEHG